MASPTVLAAYKFPMTEKPTTLPTHVETYRDIFNLQNTLRIMLTFVVEDAPADGKSYVRKDNAWVELP